jgi:hypothetical protein
MESIRQMIGTVYLAFANAVGEDALEEANKTIIDCIDTGAVDDPYARSALRTLVRASSKTMEPAWCKKMERA